MALKRAVYIVAFLLIAGAAQAQINIYLGGNLQGNYSWIRGDENTFKPGFGGGFSFAYWEYEYWFLKAGLDYVYKSSSSLEYPDFYTSDINSAEDKVILERFEHRIAVPLAIYFRPIEEGENAMIVVGSLTTMFAMAIKESSEEFGEVSFKGNEIKSRMKTNIGLGVGYQRQLDRHTYLNIYPSFNMDLRADRSFNSINLTAELLFGVY
jgi:hypothetical protein